MCLLWHLRGKKIQRGLDGDLVEPAATTRGANVTLCITTSLVMDVEVISVSTD